MMLSIYLAMQGHDSDRILSSNLSLAGLASDLGSNPVQVSPALGSHSPAAATSSLLLNLLNQSQTFQSLK